jgi:NADPH2:quinone reductase
MTNAIRFHETGGPEVLVWESVDLPPPGPGEVQVRHTAIGLNFIDTYHRTGVYPVPLPSGLGTEAAGIVEAVGQGVTDFAPGDRVAYATGPLGAYAEARNIVASVLVKLPAGIDERVAAAVMLKGMTAHYLLEIGRLPVREAGGPAPTVLVHSAAGGVGLLLVQWAKHRGAIVIGTVGSEEKAAIARAHGCDHVLLARTENISARVAELTKGQKTDVVYDSVGKDTFHASLACLRPRGLMVSFGNSSGVVPPFEPRLLAANGSLFLTRPVLGDYVRKPEELRARAADLFAAIANGVLKVRIAQTYRLRGAGTAHQDLEARRTTGSTLLIP